SAAAVGAASVSVQIRRLRAARVLKPARIRTSSPGLGAWAEDSESNASSTWPSCLSFCASNIFLYLQTGSEFSFQQSARAQGPGTEGVFRDFHDLGNFR